MSKLHTGRTYELRDTPERLRGIWQAIKDVDPKAVIVTAASDDIGVIGTNEHKAMTVGKLALA